MHIAAPFVLFGAWVALVNADDPNTGNIEIFNGMTLTGDTTIVSSGMTLAVFGGGGTSADSGAAFPTTGAVASASTQASSAGSSAVSSSKSGNLAPAMTKAPSLEVAMAVIAAGGAMVAW